MHYLRINGGKKLSGSVKISGAKNAALPLIALSILSKNEVVIKNLPAVSERIDRAMSGNAAFFAPRILTLPLSFLPPLIRR